MARDFRPLTLGEGLLQGLPRSFSGQDFKAWAYYPVNTFTKETLNQISKTNQDVLPEVLRDGQMPLGSLHTITSSFAASLSPVVRIGDSMPVDHTRGQKTFAGSMIFTLLNQDPLKELILSSEYGDTQGEFFTIDQIPPFNVIIYGDNEYIPRKGEVKSSIYKLMVGVRFVTHGESITIDDFYLEQSYQYRARYVSQWLTGTIDLESVNQAPNSPSQTGPRISPADKLTAEQLITKAHNGDRLDAASLESIGKATKHLGETIAGVTTTPATEIVAVSADGSQMFTTKRRIKQQ